MLSKFTAARERSALAFILILSLLGLLALPSAPIQAQAAADFEINHAHRLAARPHKIQTQLFRHQRQGHQHSDGQ